MKVSKNCTKCGKVRSLFDFHKNKKHRDGLASQCKYCRSKYKKEYRTQNPDKWNNHLEHCKITWKVKGWLKRLDRGFGKGASKYYKVKGKEQNGKCAICGKEPKLKLSLDHNHKTGKWRGLLCNSCNLGLGLFQTDNSNELLIKALEYIKKYEDI